MRYLTSERSNPLLFNSFNRIVWTEREDIRLMNSYKKISREKVMMLLPDRTWSAIQTRASQLRILSNAKRWTEEEDKRLMNNYRKITKEEMLKLLPSRTWSAITTRASRLNIPRKGRYYTPEEDSWLLNLYYHTNLTYKQMSQYFTTRSFASLRMRMCYLRNHLKEELNEIQV